MTYVRDDLPKLAVPTRGSYKGDDIDVLYLEHGLAVGVLVVLVGLVSLLVTIFSSIWMKDGSFGVALGTAILTLAAFVSSVFLGVACLAGFIGTINTKYVAVL